MSKPTSFRIHTFRALKPGYEAALTYYSADGKAVSQDKATRKTAEIVCRNTSTPSQDAVARSVDALADLLCQVGQYAECAFEYREVVDALDEMLTDSDQKYRVGSRVLSCSIQNDRHLNHWVEMEWAIAKLGESGRREAIDQLVDMCNIGNEGTDHYSSMESVSDSATVAIQHILEQPENREDLSLQEDVWIRLLDTYIIYPDKLKLAASKLGEVGTEKAIKPLEGILGMDATYRQQGITEAVSDALERLRAKFP